MPAYLEVWLPSGINLVALEGDRVTVGRGDANDLIVPGDTSVSELHAVLERYPSGWCVRDVGSRNGTYVNGERLLNERRLRPGDEVRLGSTRLRYRESQPRAAVPTESPEAAPDLTRREREVLVELCRPVLTGEVFSGPATIREIADALVCTESAVKHHLLRLSDKFAITERGERRRIRLANEAVTRGAVGLADLRATRRSRGT